MKVVTLLFCGIFAFVVSAVLVAQSTLVIKDAEGDTVGGFAYSPDHASGEFVVFTADGYLIRIDPEGKILQPGLGPLYYLSEDCSGTGYIADPSGQLWLFEKGGHIVQMSEADSPVPSFAKVEWSPEYIFNVTARSYKYTADSSCGSTTRTSFRGAAAEFVQPAPYNIKQRDDQTWGFKPPFRSVVERSDGIFCNSFESCPSN